MREKEVWFLDACIPTQRRVAERINEALKVPVRVFADGAGLEDAWRCQPHPAALIVDLFLPESPFKFLGSLLRYDEVCQQRSLTRLLRRVIRSHADSLLDWRVVLRVFFVILLSLMLGVAMTDNYGPHSVLFERIVLVWISLSVGLFCLAFFLLGHSNGYKTHHWLLGRLSRRLAAGTDPVFGGASFLQRRV